MSEVKTAKLYPKPPLISSQLLPPPPFCIYPEISYQAVLVGQVVGELELVEGDNLLHPLLAGGRTVRMDVHPLGHLGVRLARHNPFT